MRVRFWGTRGSIAKPGRTTLRYGGNTSCVEVRAADGTLLVLDCGTGAHGLGAELMSRSRGRLRGSFLIGHTHWDHIQGFPFFAPLFASGGDWEIYAPGGRGRSLEKALEGQMAYEYSPIAMESVSANLRLHNLTEGALELGSIRVTTQYLNHPALSLGYRLEADGATLVYATDHEPHSLHPLDAPPGAEPVHHEDRRHVRFLEDADLVIHDAQYTLEEFPAKSGWGHTPVERAVDYAILARAKRLALFHHDPSRDDDAVDELCALASERASRGDHVPQVFAAAEGEVIELSADRPAERAPVSAQPSALLSTASRPPGTVLIVEDDPDMAALLEAALRPEGVRLLHAADGESGLKLARQERPSLILLDLTLPARNGIEVCRTLRADPDPYMVDVPILILTGTKLEEHDLVEAFLAGATDYLLKPVKPSLVRSRVRGWLSRTAP